MQFDYTAKRSIIGGHSSGVTYQINISVRTDDRSSAIKGAQNETLTGALYTVIHAEVIEHTIETVACNSTTSTTNSEMREFLDSVKGGESFDIDGTTCVLTSITNPYTEIRVNSDSHRYQFKAREL